MPIKFNNVSYVYSRKTPFAYTAIKNINLTIDDGDFAAIVGQTGCGKTTLVKQMNALLWPVEGYTQIDDFIVHPKRNKIKRLKPLRKHVGLVFQFPEYQLFEETVEKDVMFGPKNFGVKHAEALEIAHKSLLKVGLDESYWKRSPFELSGGEKRRVAMAGILALETKVLVLDEPTAGLDPQSAKEMMDLFKEIHDSGVTVILVSHDMDLVLKYCNKVIVMADGEIKKVSNPKELFAGDNSEFSLDTPNVYKIAKELIRNGLKVDLNAISDVNSLANEIKRARTK